MLNIQNGLSKFYIFSHYVLNRQNEYFTNIDLHYFYTYLFKDRRKRERYDMYIKKLNQYIPSITKPTFNKLKRLTNLWRHFDKAKLQQTQRELMYLKKFDIGILNTNQIRQIFDGIELFPPFILYFRPHSISILNILKTHKWIGVVGTRSPSLYTIEQGIAKLTKVVKKAEARVGFVSGRARGCDALAHYTAQKLNIPIINFLAQIHEAPPLKSSTLSPEIQMSEYLFAPNKTFKHRLVIRNRLIAGLSHFVVILQAPIKSGSLITGKFAKITNKNIYVLKPLKITPATSGGAKLVRTYQNAQWL